LKDIKNLNLFDILIAAAPSPTKAAAKPATAAGSAGSNPQPSASSIYQVT